jgi:hypothetical protein
MTTPSLLGIFSVSDTNHTVQQVNVTIEDVVRKAFSDFSARDITRGDIDEPWGRGTFTVRMYGEVPIIVFTEKEDNITVYFSEDQHTLIILARADVKKIDDLLENPRDTNGGWRRTKQSRRGCGPCERMLHKHTPLSRRTKRSKRSKRSKRARRTLRKI